ncbi:unnamed protein product, partial [Discosporangium mesarthrocarpum]
GSGDVGKVFRRKPMGGGGGGGAAGISKRLRPGVGLKRRWTWNRVVSLGGLGGPGASSSKYALLADEGSPSSPGRGAAGLGAGGSSEDHSLAAGGGRRRSRRSIFNLLSRDSSS